MSRKQDPDDDGCFYIDGQPVARHVTVTTYGSGSRQSGGDSQVIHNSSGGGSQYPSGGGRSQYPHTEDSRALIVRDPSRYYSQGSLQRHSQQPTSNAHRGSVIVPVRSSREYDHPTEQLLQNGVWGRTRISRTEQACSECVSSRSGDTILTNIKLETGDYEARKNVHTGQPTHVWMTRRTEIPICTEHFAALVKSGSDVADVAPSYYQQDTHTSGGQSGAPGGYGYPHGY